MCAAQSLSHGPAHTHTPVTDDYRGEVDKSSMNRAEEENLESLRIKQVLEACE